MIPTIEQLKDAIRAIVFPRGDIGAEDFELALEALAQGAFEEGFEAARKENEIEDEL